MSKETLEDVTPDDPRDESAGDSENELDLRALAEEVYKLLKRELQLESERLGRPRGW